jgi:uncharacterized protein YutE (UPF0331/DUF86 family)
MYPVRLGYNTAKKRINELIKNGHHSESLVTSVFTAEKTIRRTLRQLIVSAGFKSTIANKIIKRFNGVYQLIDAWELYDPKHRKLTDIVAAADIQIIKEAAQKRNKLIHGEQVFKLDLCKAETEKVLKAFDRIKVKFDQEYNYSGWTNISTRKVSTLHSDPRVKIS